jgi:sarcosine oxidase subunit beta
VQGFSFDGDRISGVKTSRGEIACGKVALAVAGRTSELAQMAGVPTPIETHLLQAMVSEPVKPVLDTVVTFGAEEYYVSQSDKGGLVMGGALDGYASYSQRGAPSTLSEIAACAVTLFPAFSRLRIVRAWAGMMDMTMDGSPVMGKTPVPNLYLTGGWCYGGFKATPASGLTLAHTIVHDAPHPLIEGYGLDRFSEGAMLFERGLGPVPQAQ